MEMLNNGYPIVLDGKECTVRRLAFPDIFSFVKILSAVYRCAGDEFKQLFNDSKSLVNNEETDAATMEVGFKFVMLLVAGIQYCENEITEFLASLVGMQVAEFKKLSPGCALDIFEILQTHEDLMSFFKKAAKMFKLTALK